MNNIGIQEFILLVLLGLFIGWLLRPKKNATDTLSMEDIVDNDPVIKSIDEKIAKLNKDASDSMFEKYPDMKELAIKYGYNPDNLTKEELIEKKRNKVNNLKKEKLDKINTYFKNGIINEGAKKYYINCYIEFKQDDYKDEFLNKLFNKQAVDNKIHSDSDEDSWNWLLSQLDDLLENDKRRHELSLEYGEEIAERLIKSEVWLSMTESQLNESRGYPDDTEQELTPNGEIEVFIYGNKQSGSYFTLQDGKVIKIKDRQKKE